MLAPADRERTAYHESGHSLVGMLTREADPVRQISIIPRGQALGVTLLATDGSGPSLTSPTLTSEQTPWLIGQEVQRVVAQAHADATELLSGHRQQLESLAKSLLKAETLAGPDAYVAAHVVLRGAGPQRAA